MSNISNRKMDSNDGNNKNLKIKLKKMRKNSISNKKRITSIRKSRSQNYLLQLMDKDEDKCEMSNFTQNQN